MSISLKEGDDDHIRGFILNKLITLNRFGRRSTGIHHGHTETDNLSKGYSLIYRDRFPRIINAMKSNREQLIMVFSSTGKDHVCANLDQIEHGLVLCNMYRVAVGLPLLDRRFREAV